MFASASQSFRSIFFAVVCLVLLSPACYSAGEPAATEEPKIYSPFDEKAPKMPAEFAGDKRLDVKLDIAVKSTNMKDLFTDIRKATGVNVVVAKELSGERPIVFFHDKPLRDVMTEISALYGYFWLAKGKEGAWTYELFEDMVHAKRREQVRNDQETAQVDSLLDCIDICTKALESEAALERLRQTSPRLYNSATEPLNNAIMNVAKLMDRDALRGLINDVGQFWAFSTLSPEMQAAVRNVLTIGGGSGDDPSSWADDRVSSATVQFKRWRSTLFTPPHIILIVSVPATTDGTRAGKFFEEWPDYDDGEPDLLSMSEAPPGKVIGDPLGDIKITVEKKHELFNSGAILVQDVLDAIARQANLNIIADYYYLDTEMEACSDVPLDKLVPDLCLKMGYTCQVEKDTLRFKCNKWYLQALQQEPPSEFQEALWKRLADTGALTLDDLLDIACLPDQQTFWGGFRFIPQASQARLFPRTARLVRMLGSTLETEASNEKGLPVSKLDAEQFSRIADWAGVVGIKESPEGLLKSTIRIERTGQPETKLQFTLTLPDGTPRNVALNARLEPFDEKARRTLAEERAAELAADKVELSPARE